MRLSLFCIIALCSHFFLSCENQFSPIAEFRPGLVVYSVLSSESDTQYVRVYTSFDQTTAKTGLAVTDASVQLSDGSSTFSFSDTTLQSIDSTATPESFRLYYNPSMRPLRGKTYSLFVTSASYGSVSATTVVPDGAQVLINDIPVLADPLGAAPSLRVRVSVLLSATAQAFLPRLFIYFNAQTRTVPSYDREERVEVPMKFGILSRVRGNCEYFFPSLQRRTGKSSSISAYLEGFVWDRAAYLQTLANIQYNYLNVRFSRAVFHVVQFDEAFFKYYQLANLYRDRASVRLDEPDFTNIIGGVGLFGSLSVDSAVAILPERIPVDFGFVCSN